MSYTQISPELYLINLGQKLEGFRDFISSWLYNSGRTVFLVDPGPKYSIDELICTLEEMGVKKIDYIFLTHIHIDHAGGTGKLLEKFQDARVICHTAGIEHMIDPAKLWKGSLKILGEIAEAYGEILPVPADRISFKENIETVDGTIRVINTPGHAAHHQSYIFKEYIFAGEVAGVNQPLRNKVYSRPATPPQFRPEISLASLDRAVEQKPGIICYGHYGFRKDAVNAMTSAREQLLLWMKIIKEQIKSGEDNFKERVIEILMQRDSIFSNFTFLDNDIKKREVYFAGNSINGMKEYYKEFAMTD